MWKTLDYTRNYKRPSKLCGASHSPATTFLSPSKYVSTTSCSATLLSPGLPVHPYLTSASRAHPSLNPFPFPKPPSTFTSPSARVLFLSLLSRPFLGPKVTHTHSPKVQWYLMTAPFHICCRAFPLSRCSSYGPSAAPLLGWGLTPPTVPWSQEEWWLGLRWTSSLGDRGTWFWLS